VSWTFRGLEAALDRWIADEDPDLETIEQVLYWVSDLRDDPEDESTTVIIDDTSATRVGCAPGTTVLMRFTLDRSRERLIVHHFATVHD
jgi:hypothetical protein